MLRRFKRAMMEIIAHTILVLTLLTSFWLVEEWCKTLWHGRVFYGGFELKHLFDVADAGALSAFLVCGTYHAIRAYNGLDENE